MKTPAQGLQGFTPEAALSPARAFVVQFREQTAGVGRGFSGRAEHMISGQATRFESPEQLLAFFEAVLNAVPRKLSDQG